MTENPAGSNYGLGRGKCAIVELKAVGGCEERRLPRSVEGLVKKTAWCTPIACSRAVGNPAQLLLGEGP